MESLSSWWQNLNMSNHLDIDNNLKEILTWAKAKCNSNSEPLYRLSKYMQLIDVAEEIIKDRNQEGMKPKDKVLHDNPHLKLVHSSNK